MNKKLLSYLERFITEERKERFLEIIAQRTNHFTVAMEDVFQMHNTSAVVRTCEVFGVQQAHSIEGRFGKRLDAKIAMGAQKWVDVFRYNDTQRHRKRRSLCTSAFTSRYFLKNTNGGVYRKFKHLGSCGYCLTTTH